MGSTILDQWLARDSTHGFLRERNGTFRVIEVPGTIATQARGLNDNDQVVGYYTDATARNRGFLWDAGAFFTFDLSTIGAHLTIDPRGINNRGQIVGSFAEFPCLPGCEVHGFLLHLHDQTVTVLDVLNARGTVPTGINDRGDVVGSYVDDRGQRHGFVMDRWSIKTVDAPFSPSTEIDGINNRGELVGRYLALVQPDPTVWVLWRFPS